MQSIAKTRRENIDWEVSNEFTAERKLILSLFLPFLSLRSLLPSRLCVELP
jgi:hypothetical protein